MTSLPYSIPTPPLGGTIKQRYSDFLVEEIGRDGTRYALKRFLHEDGLRNPTPIEVPAQPDDRTYSQLHCTLEKFNADMPFVLHRLSRFLQLSRKRIGYAGLKDKRAITAQRISLFNPNIESLVRFHSPTLDLRDFEWHTDRIEIGDLTGNRFTITIRKIEENAGEIRNRIESFFDMAAKSGIANFFGEQRFGGIRNNTHLVGKHLLRGELEEGILLYLTHESAQEPAEITAIRHTLSQTRDYRAALNAFPFSFRFERAMLSHLALHPSDFAGALQKLPKHMRYLFTHAWQAHLFNELLSKRITRGFKLTAIEGDCLEDGVVVLPLFGFETQFSSGIAGELEQEVLTENGFSLEQFKTQKIAEISSRGSSRAAAIFPQNAALTQIGADEFNDGFQKAVVSFELPKGSYATTVLNELMKKVPRKAEE